jgi:hypothetical protein
MSMPRLLAMSRFAPKRSAPPLRMMFAAVKAAGAAPSAPSALTCNTPPVTVVPPVYVLPAFVSASVPGPALMMPPVPATFEPIVALTPTSVVIDWPAIVSVEPLIA